MALTPQEQPLRTERSIAHSQSAANKGAGRSAFRWRPDQQWEAYIFLLPSLAGFLLFVILPVLGSLLLSFGTLRLNGAFNLAGLDNYRDMLRDPVFWRAVRNTVYFMVTIVPLQLAFGMVLALALNQPLRGLVVQIWRVATRVISACF